ncbi:MAG: YaiI/YqxD family protein [Desulfurivibrionaceae bacterium]|nr:YaiI/YqxD family protein [Desulfurivibrionaceae bacterium]
MKIWVDADACPAVIKEILFRAAERLGLRMTLVANHPLRVPASKLIAFVQVSSGLDVADSEIVKRVGAGDLVITADIPLAAEVVEKGASALNPRGEMYTAENVRDRLSMRDFMEGLRRDGIDTGGPAPLGPRDRQTFANSLDKFLSNYARYNQKNGL